MKSGLPRYICGICGVLMLLQFFIPAKFVQETVVEWVANSIMIVGCFGLAIGLASLIHSHGTRIRRKTPGWGFSVVTLATAAIVAFVGLVPRSVTFDQADKGVVAHTVTTRVDRIEYTVFGYQPETSNLVASAATGNMPVQRTSKPLFDWAYNYMLYPLGGTTFALLAFYIMTAAYRAMRVKSWEAGLLLSSALVVLLGQIPVEEFLPWVRIHGISVFERLKELIMNFPNMASQRGILIGVALGALATSVKIIAGIERPYMGGRS